MKKNILVYIFTIFLVNASFAQNVDFKASNFRDKKDEYKIAVSNIDQGDELLKKAGTLIKEKKEAKKVFADALAFYLKAQQFNAECAELNYKIGKSYLHTFTKTKAIPFLEKAIKYDPSVDKEAYYLLGQAYQFNYKFDDAKKQYKIYKEKLSSGQLEDLKKEIDKKILECESGIILMSEPKRVWITNVDKLNSEYDDYCSAITADESVMYFNSKRPQNTGGTKDANDEYLSDIYTSTRQNGVWSEPVNVGEPLNTAGSDECEALSPDGQKMFICKNEKGNYNIYISTLKGDKWLAPEKLPEKKINTDFNETNASFSYDGIKRYYISDQQGNKDIFFSGVKDVKINDWGLGQKIGFGLNTLYDEGSIWMHPDGNTLYFASKGFNSMGGYDIFKSIWMDVGQWSEPVNMGYPINSPYDDIYFFLSASGKHAYLSSDREKDSKGNMDIFKVQFLGPEKPAVVDNEDQLLSGSTEPVKEATPIGPVQVETMHLTVLRGRTLDSYTKQPVEAEIEIVDNVKNQVVYTARSNSKTGKFLVSLPAGINYGIAIKADKYLFYSENFDLPKLSDYQLIDKEIDLKNICIGCTIVLRNIFFDFGKSELRTESTTELNRIIQLMKDIPQIKVEISGHTDNIGSETSNQKLSEDRAKAVVAHLVKNGIPATRLVFKGYGSSKPLAPNDTEANRQQNRRTEFKIIEN